jgi:hypothetical protein
MSPFVLPLPGGLASGGGSWRKAAARPMLYTSLAGHTGFVSEEDSNLTYTDVSEVPRGEPVLDGKRFTNRS